MTPTKTKLYLSLLLFCVPSIAGANPLPFFKIPPKPQGWRNRLVAYLDRLPSTKLQKNVGIDLETDVDRIQNHFTATLNQPFETYSIAIRDEISSLWFYNIIDQSAEDTVFLGLGNGITPLSSEEATQIFQLAQKLYMRGTRVLYDFDSQAASTIEAAIPEGFRLGLSGNWKNSSKNVLVLSNPYVRMKKILSLKSILLSPDSLLGLGLLFEGYADFGTRFLILDPLNLWRSHGLSAWAESLARENRNLGISYPAYQDPQAFSTAEGIITRLKDYQLGPQHSGNPIRKVETAKIPRYDIPRTLSQIPPSYLLQMQKRAATYTRMSTTLSQISKNDKTARNSAVLFGSARGSLAYNSLVADISKAFADQNYSITTGGAGGFMKVANRAAFKAGGISIGIQLGGIHRLLTELHLSDPYQTLTVNVPGYEFRIPLLLQDRNIVMLAPGGRGTMKELAVTCVKYAAALNESVDESPWILLLGKEYYHPLFSWFQDLPLPNTFKKKLRLMNSIKDLNGWFVES